MAESNRALTDDDLATIRAIFEECAAELMARPAVEHAAWREQWRARRERAVVERADDDE